MRFGIDLDGVLADFGKQVIKTANEMWPGKMPLDYLPQQWSYTDIFTKEEFSKLWEQIRLTDDFWQEEQPYYHAVKSLQDFLEYNKKADVYFITSRVETTGESVLRQCSFWLQTYQLWPRYGHSTVIPVADPKYKLDIIAGLKLPFMLDDYDVTVEHLQKLDNCKTYLLDQPWNRHAKNLPRLFSVADYLEIVEKSQ